MGTDEWWSCTIAAIETCCGTAALRVSLLWQAPANKLCACRIACKTLVQDICYCLWPFMYLDRVIVQRTLLYAGTTLITCIYHLACVWTSRIVETGSQYLHWGASCNGLAPCFTRTYNKPATAKEATLTEQTKDNC